MKVRGEFNWKKFLIIFTCGLAVAGTTFGISYAYVKANKKKPFSISAINSVMWNWQKYGSDKGAHDYSPYAPNDQNMLNATMSHMEKEDFYNFILCYVITTPEYNGWQQININNLVFKGNQLTLNFKILLETGDWYLIKTLSPVTLISAFKYEGIDQYYAKNKLEFGSLDKDKWQFSSNTADTYKQRSIYLYCGDGVEESDDESHSNYENIVFPSGT